MMYLYAKFNDCKGFRAFDYTAGNFAPRLIYCTLIEDTPTNRAKLQRLADLNKGVGAKFQLREAGGRVAFTTA